MRVLSCDQAGRQASKCPFVTCTASASCRGHDVQVIHPSSSLRNASTPSGEGHGCAPASPQSGMLQNFSSVMAWNFRAGYRPSARHVNRVFLEIFGLSVVHKMSCVYHANPHIHQDFQSRPAAACNLHGENLSWNELPDPINYFLPE